MSHIDPVTSSTVSSEITGRPTRLRTLVSILILGFASGLPLSLTGYAMQAWLTAEGVALATVGAFSLVALPYTFKFLWAPLMDSFDLPFFGARRGWVLFTQLALAAALLAMASISPLAHIEWFAVMALLVAFLSASQDVVVDAYRTEVLPPALYGLGTSFFMLGYRLAMLVSGGVTLIWADTALSSGWSWPQIYQTMAGVTVGLALLSAAAIPSLPAVARVRGVARRDLLGFLAVVTATAVGWLTTKWLLRPAFAFAFQSWQTRDAVEMSLQDASVRWADLGSLLLGITLTVPLIAWAAKVGRFDTLVHGLEDYFSRPGAWALLGLIVMYRLGDSFAGALMTPFLLKGMTFSMAEVGVVTSVLGLWLSFFGSILGGMCMLQLGLWRALLVFGILKAVTVLGYAWLAIVGKGYLPGFVMPAFDAGLVRFSQSTPLDGGLILVTALDNVCGGMVMTAFAALLMSLCNLRFAATQFALLSALSALGRIWVGPMVGVLAESIGWKWFFSVSAALALPGLCLLWWLRERMVALESPAPAR